MNHKQPKELYKFSQYTNSLECIVQNVLEQEFNLQTKNTTEPKKTRFTRRAKDKNVIKKSRKRLERLKNANQGALRMVFYAAFLFNLVVCKNDQDALAGQTQSPTPPTTPTATQEAEFKLFFSKDIQSNTNPKMGCLGLEGSELKILTSLSASTISSINLHTNKGTEKAWEVNIAKSAYTARCLNTKMSTSELNIAIARDINYMALWTPKLAGPIIPSNQQFYTVTAWDLINGSGGGLGRITAVRDENTDPKTYKLFLLDYDTKTQKELSVKPSLEVKGLRYRNGTDNTLVVQGTETITEVNHYSDKIVGGASTTSITTLNCIEVYVANAAVDGGAKITQLLLGGGSKILRHSWNSNEKFEQEIISLKGNLLQLKMIPFTEFFVNLDTSGQMDLRKISDMANPVGIAQTGLLAADVDIHHNYPLVLITGLQSANSDASSIKVYHMKRFCPADIPDCTTMDQKTSSTTKETTGETGEAGRVGGSQGASLTSTTSSSSTSNTGRDGSATPGAATSSTGSGTTTNNNSGGDQDDPNAPLISNSGAQGDSDLPENLIYPKKVDQSSFQITFPAQESLSSLTPIQLSSTVWVEIIGWKLDSDYTTELTLITPSSIMMKIVPKEAEYLKRVKIGVKYVSRQTGRTYTNSANSEYFYIEKMQKTGPELDERTAEITKTTSRTISRYGEFISLILSSLNELVIGVNSVKLFTQIPVELTEDLKDLVSIFASWNQTSDKVSNAYRSIFWEEEASVGQNARILNSQKGDLGLFEMRRVYPKTPQFWFYASYVYNLGLKAVFKVIAYVPAVCLMLNYRIFGVGSKSKISGFFIDLVYKFAISLLLFNFFHTVMTSCAFLSLPVANFSKNRKAWILEFLVLIIDLALAISFQLFLWRFALKRRQPGALKIEKGSKIENHQNRETQKISATTRALQRTNGGNIRLNFDPMNQNKVNVVKNIKEQNFWRENILRETAFEDYYSEDSTIPLLLFENLRYTLNSISVFMFCSYPILCFGVLFATTLAMGFILYLKIGQRNKAEVILGFIDTILLLALLTFFTLLYSFRSEAEISAASETDSYAEEGSLTKLRMATYWLKLILWAFIANRILKSFLPFCIAWFTRRSETDVQIKPKQSMVNPVTKNVIGGLEGSKRSSQGEGDNGRFEGDKEKAGENRFKKSGIYSNRMLGVRKNRRQRRASRLGLPLYKLNKQIVSPKKLKRNKNAEDRAANKRTSMRRESRKDNPRGDEVNGDEKRVRGIAEHLKRAREVKVDFPGVLKAAQNKDSKTDNNVMKRAQNRISFKAGKDSGDREVVQELRTHKRRRRRENVYISSKTKKEELNEAQSSERAWILPVPSTENEGLSSIKTGGKLQNVRRGSVIRRPSRFMKGIQIGFKSSINLRKPSKRLSMGHQGTEKHLE